jgi:CMP-N-acetylneuraminic acid synthetase
MKSQKFTSLAVIPARSGSKRLPRKNFLEFRGKPMVEWTIKSACESEIFNKIVFSSDDKLAEQISKKYPVNFQKRESQLANDKSSLVDVCLDIIKKESQKGNFYDFIFCLYATSPLRDANDLKNIFKILTEKNAAAVMAVTKYLHYPHQALKVNSDTSISYYWPDKANIRSEKMPKLLAGNGSTYAIKVDKLIKYKNFVPPADVYSYEMPIWKSLDIDTKDDFEMLNKMFR